MSILNSDFHHGLLGIGVTVAMFSIVYGVALRPLPYADPDRLVVLHDTHPERTGGAFGSWLVNFRDWQQQAKSFSGMAIFAHWTFNLTGRAVPERILGSRVSGEFFDILGAPPILGRTLIAADDGAGREFVAVLSHGGWQRVFGGDPSVVGQIVALNGQPHTIVGVMPPSFRFPDEDVELWAPLGDQLRGTSRESRFMLTVARLDPDVTLESAGQEMALISGRLAEAYPDENAGWRVSVISAHETIVGDIRPVLLALLGAVSFVLLIACGNVANLLLARATARRRESAIRAAIGAGRGRLVRQFLTESLVLSVIGTTLGVALAWAAMPLLLRAQPADLPRLSEVNIDLTICAFAAAVAVVTTMLFGLLPAWHGARTSLAESLHAGGGTSAGGGRAGRRLRDVLVVVEVALSLTLLIGGGLMLRSMSRLLDVDPGFDAANVLRLSVFLGPPTYGTVAAQKAYVTRALEQLAQIGGVTMAAAVTQVPMVDTYSVQQFRIEGRAVEPAQALTAQYRAVSEDYFATMSIAVLLGRGVRASDDERSAPVVVINQTMARRFWPDGSPIGQRLTGVRDGGFQEWMTIVGVVGDVKSGGLHADEQPAIYAPYRQREFPWLRWSSFVVRSAASPLPLVQNIRAALLEVDPNQPVYGITTLAAVVRQSTADRRLGTALVSLFALLAVILASVGIYGVIACSVVDRTHEIGVRLALGARPRNVLAMVCRHGLGLTALGVLAGLGCAFLVTRFLATLLFDVSPTDPATFVTIPLVLFVVAGIACYLPARRATRVDPMVTLRSE